MKEKKIRELTPGEIRELCAVSSCARCPLRGSSRCPYCFTPVKDRRRTSESKVTIKEV